VYVYGDSKSRRTSTPKLLPSCETKKATHKLLVLNRQTASHARPGTSTQS